MLVLSRKTGEKIVIGDDICITINRIGNDRVSIGIEAPPAVTILRGELTPHMPSGDLSMHPLIAATATTTLK